MKKLATLCVLVAVIGCSTLKGPTGQQTIQGRIDSLDRGRGIVRLVDGTTVSIPPNISTRPLAEGQEVTIAYRPGPNGQKEMTAVWVNSSPNNDTSM